MAMKCPHRKSVCMCILHSVCVCVVNPVKSQTNNCTQYTYFILYRPLQHFSPLDVVIEEFSMILH